MVSFVNVFREAAGFLRLNSVCRGGGEGDQGPHRHGLLRQGWFGGNGDRFQANLLSVARTPGISGRTDPTLARDPYSKSVIFKTENGSCPPPVIGSSSLR